MLNEIEEFKAYTQQPTYAATGKRDTSYMGRFTVRTFTEFEGLGRILTIIARGYLFQEGKNPYERIEYARNALCAWCSIPEKTKKALEGRLNPKVNFSDLASAFPELVDEKGNGWLYRHVYSIIQFVKDNPSIASKSAADNCEIIKEGFTREWKKKVRQMQVPAFALNTKGAWILRFDDILADALELGPLQNYDISLPQETLDLLAEITPKGVPDTLLSMLAKYYLAHKQESEDWVVLPVSAVDAYYSSNSFSKKWKPILPKDLVLFKNSYGICKYQIRIGASIQ